MTESESLDHFKKANCTLENEEGGEPLHEEIHVLYSILRKKKKRNLAVTARSLNHVISEGENKFGPKPLPTDIVLGNNAT